MSVRAVSRSGSTHVGELEHLRQQHVARDNRVGDLVAQARMTQDHARRKTLLDEAVLVARPLAAALARRYHRRGIEDQDLEQVAMLGLCKAVHGFQPDRGVSFAAYAVPTITGELKRHFRDAGWVVRPTRSVQEFGPTMRAGEERLVQSIGRQPSTAEVATFLGVSTEDVAEARQAERGFWAESLDTPHGPTGQALGITLADPHDDFELVDAGLVVGAAVAALTARERHIIELRYINGMTQAEIGAVIGTSQMQASRLLRDILAKLRSRIDEPAASRDWTAAAGPARIAPAVRVPSA